MATVEVSFTPLPAHVRTARLVATAVARRSGVEEALLDEVRLAVGEACSRAVEAHRRNNPAEPVRIALTDGAGRFEVAVTDTGDPHGAVSNGDGDGTGAAGAVADGSAVPGLPDPVPLGAGSALGLAVIRGLADDVQISETADGVTIRMSWPAGGARR
jgi:serine/threonine-protein kinase RsbW